MSTAVRRILTILLLVLATGTTALYARTNGQKIKVKEVDFHGNKAFSTHRLHRVMLSRPSTLFNTVYYYPRVFQDDLAQLETFYQQNGYLEARITGHKVEIDTAKSTAHIEIDISEGPLTRVEAVQVLGNSVFPDADLLEKVKIHPGDPLERKMQDRATRAMLTMYAEKGYLDASVKVDVRVNQDTHLALVDFIITEGLQFRIGQIDIRGLEKTKPYVVKRELRFKTGQIVRYSRLLQTQRQLYRTGLFQSVFIRPVPAASGDSMRKDIEVDLKETLSREINASVGFGSVDKVRGQFQVYNYNYAGTARKIAVTTKLSFVNRHIEASFTEPWTFGVPWRTDVNALAEYLEQPGYNLGRVGGRVTVGRQLLKNSKIEFSYRQENARLTNVRLATPPADIKPRIRSLKQSLILDSRDDLFNPTKGVYLEASNEFAGAFLQGNISFIRSMFRFAWIKNFGPATILATGLELGWVDAAGGLEQIPLNERFYTGGPNSLRGFDYQKVGPLDENRVPIGGRIKLVFNAFELRQSFYKIVGGAVFLDMGDVWTAPRFVRGDEIRTSPGVGLRINTPIGLARLDYGFNIFPKPGEPHGKLYFSVGQAF